MIRKPALLILAAGVGSRYGGLKQMDRFGPSGETIIDYSVFDALRAGFGKIVFVIRKSLEIEFKDAILSNFPDKIQTETVHQELDLLPEGYSLPENRTKPWGTGHAVWVAASVIKEPFAVINADDFYGPGSFLAMADFLQNNNDEYQHSLMGYQLKNTLSQHGSVSRGICKIDFRNDLVSIEEHKDISLTDNGIISRLASGQKVPFQGDEIVSMNMMGFDPSVFQHFERYFRKFLSESIRNPMAEFYLPTVVNNLINSKIARVKTLFTTEKWFGVTYSEDKPLAISNLANLIKTGIYPEKLWSKTGKEN